MDFKLIKKETKLTRSRKLKKKHFKKLNVYNINSTCYYFSFTYNKLKYFLHKNLISLNNKVIHLLLKEEIGFFFSLTTWITFFNKKVY